jgi:hypothetical protein
MGVFAGGNGSVGKVTITVANLLPITLLTFQARPQAGGILLEWRTAAELNNDYMAVERSADGRVFDEIGRVPGQGDSYAPRSYSFRDEYPLRGINYYRLRQVDYDGRMEYHPIITVAFEAAGGLSLEAFPSPAAEELRLRWSARDLAGARDVAVLRLYDIQGRPLGEYPVSGAGGVFYLPVKGLAPGVYLVELWQRGERVLARFVKG